MQRVTGIGGIFFKSQNPDRLYEWYEKHLGIKRDGPAPPIFHWREADKKARKAMTVWSLFPVHTKYFGEGPQTFMLNYRVANLDAVMRELRSAHVAVEPKIDESEYGKFGWLTDPEGNRIELWQPPEEKRPAKRSAKRKSKSRPKSRSKKKTKARKKKR